MRKRPRGTALIHRVSFYTLLSLFLLILAGGVVRSTGSGMGCPDWPKCFGQWVPPTSADVLPENYREQYSEFRNKKNIKFSGLLSFLGFEGIAENILSDKSILEENEFNAFNTWVEYINRLWGAITGLFIVVLVFVSFKNRKTDRSYFFLTFGILVLTGFQGWLGSIVVSTNLLSFLVSMHMFIAFIIVGMVLYVYVKSSPANDQLDNLYGIRMLNGLGILALLIFLIQVFFGVELREAIDGVASGLNYSQRSSWVEKAGYNFIIHRSFSWLVLISNLVFAYLVIKRNKEITDIVISAKLMIALVILEILSGITLAYLNFPAIVQPVHLLIASLIFSNQLLILFQINQKEVKAVYRLT